MKTVSITHDQYCDLEAKLADLSCLVERAACVLQDVTEEYFGGTLDVKDLWKLKAGFKEHGVKAEIAFDYIYQSQKLIDEAEKLVNSL
ncbi:hypothetical protein Q5O24_12480 [Eubacteriaceae bacterium ES3]|nr:hypothetical protein Q5O24_12480 [Eubacteriaceae bacterium ES3]